MLDCCCSFNDGPEKLHPLCPVLNHRLCGGCQQPRLWGRQELTGCERMNDGGEVTELKVFAAAFRRVSGLKPSLSLCSCDLTVHIYSPVRWCMPAQCRRTPAEVHVQEHIHECIPLLFELFPFLSVPTNANSEIEISADWQIIACIWTSFMYVAYPKLLFSCIGWKMHFEISWLIWVVLKWKHSLYLAHPFCSSPLFAHIQLFTMSCMWFSSFSKCQLSYLRRTLGVTCSRWPSMCKLTFRFLN